MATVSIRGKEKVITHFKNAGNSHWKLYNAADSKSPLQTCLNVKDVPTSLEFLNEILDNIDPNGIYTLDTYAKNDERGEQKFLRPTTSVCFSLSETTTTSVNSPTEEKKTFSSTPASLKDHIDLIRENAKLSAECSMYKQYWEESIKKITELENLVDELEDELEEYEEEAEQEEEEKKVSGTDSAPQNVEQAIAQLIKDHGGALVENIMNKGVKSDIKFDEEKEEGEIKVNGIGDEMPDIHTIVSELVQKDSQFQKHLYKLLLIARQKPNTFKMFLKKLEEF